MTKLNNDDFLTCMNDKVFRNIIKTYSGKKVISEIFYMITGYKMDIEPLNDDIKVSNKTIKGKRVDFISSDNNCLLNIEINNYEVDLVRNIIYMFSLFVNDILVGENYKMHKEFYQINFSHKSKLSKIMSEFGVCEISEGIVILPGLKIIEIDMEIIWKICYDNDVRCIERLYKYVGMLCADEELLKKLSKGDELLMELKEEIVAFNKEGRFFITPEEDEIMYINAIKTSSFEEGQAEGEKIGEARGEEIGEARGEKKGVLKTAKNMILNGFDNAMISKITGLSIGEVEKICK